MKTKLTLTIRKGVIERAKKIARERNVSLSGLFEEIFEGNEVQPIKNKQQKAAGELLDMLENTPKPPQSDKSDMELIKDHVRRKYS